MTPELWHLIEKHTGKRAILDSNVLLLYLVAEFDISLVGSSYKRLSTFQVQDIVLLRWLFQRFSSVATTPHVLTEVSNLSNQMPEWVKVRWFPWFGQRLAEFAELALASREIGQLESFHRFGLTDAGLAQLADKYVIVTNEWPLTGFLESRKLPVINFTHLRQIWLLA
jgi:hypothetical protein